MQKKTIQKNIKAKIEDWLSTITDNKLRESIEENLLVSGGCVASMFLNEPVNDYDVYLMDMDVVKKIAEYYSKPYDDILIFDGRNKESLQVDAKNDGEVIDSYSVSVRNLKEDQIKLYFEGAQGGKRVNEDKEIENLNYEPLYFSPNAISLSNNLQIVLRFWGNAEQIHKTFDFIHATNYYTTKEGLVTNLDAVESLITKQLKYQGSLYPVTSIIRAKKFTKRGFNINAGELLKIMFQVSLLDLSNPDVLEEQLIGVDVAYFDLLITALRNKKESDPKFKLSSDYFNAIIEKVFNESE